MTLYLGAFQTPVCTCLDDLAPFLDTAASHAEPTFWLFPELFYGGFDYEQRLRWAAENQDLLVRLQDFCDQTGHALAGSFWERRDNALYNSLYVVSGEHPRPQRIYSKLHLFPGVDESRFLTPGEPCPRPVTWRGLRIGGAICFDLRFPELFRLQARQDMDLFAVAGQWAQTRLPHWRRLLTARAIETQAYMLAANAVGETPVGHLPGYSCLVSPWGKLLFSCHRGPRAMRAPFDPELIRRARRLFTTRDTPHFVIAGRAGKGCPDDREPLEAPGANPDSP